MKHVLKHQKLLLKASNFKRKKFSNGGGMLGKRMEARTGEVMAKELGIRDSKLIYAQANGQAMVHVTAPGRLGDAEDERLSQC